MTNNDWIIYLVSSCLYWFSFGVLIEKAIQKDERPFFMFVLLLVLFLVFSFLFTEALIAS